jgi:caa(3)-type oxidase subunit IV
MSHDAHDSNDPMHFNAEKIFGALFLFTMLEVGWGYAGHHFHWNKLMLWGGLLFFAFLKGWLIAVYFMHLKFEGWVVKSLILPTPFLIMVIMGYVMPDVADEGSHLVHPVGAMLDPASGLVIDDLREGQATHASAAAGKDAAGR